MEDTLHHCSSFLDTEIMYQNKIIRQNHISTLWKTTCTRYASFIIYIQVLNHRVWELQLQEERQWRSLYIYKYWNSRLCWTIKTIKKTHNGNKILTTNITIEPLRWRDMASDEMRNDRDQLKRSRSIKEIERVTAEEGEIERVSAEEGDWEDRRRSLKGHRRRNRRSFREDRHRF